MAPSDQQPEKRAKVGCTERCGGLFDDALECGYPRLTLLLAAGLFCLVLFLLPFPLGLGFPSLRFCSAWY